MYLKQAIVKSEEAGYHGVNGLHRELQRQKQQLGRLQEERPELFEDWREAARREQERRQQEHEARQQEAQQHQGRRYIPPHLRGDGARPLPPPPLAPRQRQQQQYAVYVPPHLRRR